jgi:glycyl-tRNA synthetase beta chain
MPDFLLEIGCEEIPARMIDAASQELRERVSALLIRERLAASEVIHFDTPRRLAVMAHGVPASQPDATEQITGPSVNVAYKNGEPTAGSACVCQESWRGCLAAGKNQHGEGRVPGRKGDQ